MKKKTVATIECRMTSTRLPGKVLLKSCGKPMLELLVERIRKIKKIDDIIFATTTNADDNAIEDLAHKIGIKCFRGSEEDVLNRVLLAAESVNSDIIVELSGDCPLIDPNIVSQTLDLYLNNDCDYASNDHKFFSFPLGMDVEIFSTNLLKIANNEGITPEDREHVSWFFIRNPERFRLLMLSAPPNLKWPELRLTLDQKEDYELINTIFSELYSENHIFTCGEIISFINSNPELIEINKTVKQRGFTTE